MAMAADAIVEKINGRDRRRARRKFVGSLLETAARAVVTASVTFAVGLVLKRSFEKGVAQAAEQGAAAGAQGQPLPSDLATVTSPGTADMDAAAAI
jgi:uncharacterized protein (DUF697 family)